MMDEEAATSAPSAASTAVRIAVPLAGLAALFALGAWVYTHLVGGILYQAQSATILPTGLVLVLAVLAGAASFFSPCSLVITPGFLAYFIEKDAREGVAPDARRLFLAAALIAIGIVAVSAVAGILVGAIGASVYNVLIYLIPIVGAVFVILGLMMLLGRGSGLAWASRYLPGHRAYQRMLDKGVGNRPGELIAFGAAYGAASHSCTLPVVIGMLMLPIAAENYWLAGIAMLIYGVALAGLMLLMLTLGQPVVLELRRSIGRYLHYLVGALFVATGGYLFLYFAPIVSAGAQPAAGTIPVFRLVEGAPGSADPYSPRVLHIPAGRKVALDITDNIGGCALVTVFPGLGANDDTVRAMVPVGQTRRVSILAARPGLYRYHCSENMFFGDIVAS